MLTQHTNRGAGVIIVRSGQVLLGREADGWSGFGGGAKGSESCLKTAARETEEESVGIVSAAFVRRRARACFSLSTPRGNRFSMFILQLRSCDASITVDDFAARRAQTLIPECQEKLELMWFPMHSVPHLKLRKGFSNDWAMIDLAIQIVCARDEQTA